MVSIIAIIAITAASCASSGGGGTVREAPGKWSFTSGLQGWALASSEFYMYASPIRLSFDDKTFGKGLLRMDVDFTAHKSAEWSEPKIMNDFPRAFNMNGVKQLVFDFYYNPSNQSAGTFKAKVFTNNNGILVDQATDDIIGGDDAGDGFLKKEVVIPIKPVVGYMTDMRFSIAGCLTDYKGPIFIGNMRWE